MAKLTQATTGNAGGDIWYDARSRGYWSDGRRITVRGVYTVAIDQGWEALSVLLQSLANESLAIENGDEEITLGVGREPGA